MSHWISQFRRGLLELCVLNLLYQQSDHGYQIVQRLKLLDGMDVRESSVYPVLARLKTDGFVTVHDEPSPAGPPRRVFGLTAAGLEHRRTLNAYWDLLAQSVNAVRMDSQEQQEGHAS
jgi:PadR family transcriptional regulator PadR